VISPASRFPGAVSAAIMRRGLTYVRAGRLLIGINDDNDLHRIYSWVRGRKFGAFAVLRAMWGGPLEGADMAQEIIRDCYPDLGVEA